MIPILHTSSDLHRCVFAYRQQKILQRRIGTGIIFVNRLNETLPRWDYRRSSRLKEALLMKKMIILLLLALLSFALMGGAEEILEAEVTEAEMPEAPVDLGFGFLAGFLPLDLGPLNAILGNEGHPELPERLMVFGSFSNLWDDVPMSIGSIMLQGTVAASTDERKSSLTLNFWGGTGEYVRQFGNGSELGIGAALGMGSVILQVRHRAADDIFDLIARPTLSRAYLTFWGGIPYLRMQIHPLEWLRVEGVFGYLLAFSCPWTENGTVVEGLRPSFNAPFIAVRVSLSFPLPDELPAE